MAQAARAMVVEEKARAADMASAKQADDISAKARQGWPPWHSEKRASLLEHLEVGFSPPHCRTRHPRLHLLRS